MKRLWLLALVMLSATGAGPEARMQPLSIEVQGLRSMKGNILICVTRDAAHFPDCRDDPERRHFSIAASDAPVALGQLAPGSYAIAIIHDENGNGKLDTFAGIPREGVGFSHNPAIRFGAPSFRSAQFAIAGNAVRQDIKIKYFL